MYYISKHFLTHHVNKTVKIEIFYIIINIITPLALLLVCLFFGSLPTVTAAITGDTNTDIITPLATVK